jgi:drug/metabolite transporter (DMT)-like permease
MRQTQSAWALVGCLNAIALAILVLGIAGTTFTFWRIVGGALVIAAIFVLLMWHWARHRL